MSSSPDLDHPCPNRECLVAARAAFGVLLIWAPKIVLREITGAEIGSGTRLFSRILGARHLAEAALLARAPSRRRVFFGAGVDAAHAATMIALSIIRPRTRRAALTNALGASMFAAAGAAVGRSRVASPAALPSGESRLPEIDRRTMSLR